MRRTYNTNSQFKLKTAMLMWFLCDYSDKHVLVSETITIPRRRADQAARQTDERNKRVLFKHCATFTDCINEISNTEIDNAEDLDVVMSM